ncbi:MAG TPA: ADOP family duplicated permease [Terriglobales bacterium]|nr:ADOP family duplicated permease [Terriglobales bacterium]
MAWEDLRTAVRIFNRKPGLALAVILSIGLGIGANTAIFTLADALLLRMPAGILRPARLAEVWTISHAPNSPLGGRLPVSYQDFEYFRDHNHTFANLAAYAAFLPATPWIRKSGSTELHGQLVSANYFATLGVRPALGRAFAASEDRVIGGSAVAVVSDSFWRRQLGGTRAALGRQLDLNGHEFTIIGVAPRGFEGMIAGFAPDFWAPITMADALGAFPGLLTRGAARGLFLIGRLAPGASRGAAAQDADRLARQLDRLHPDTDNNLDATALASGALPAILRTDLGALGALLLAAVGLVLLVACANAANLQLAQAYARRREWAVRAALGASRGRIMRLMLTESVLLALAAGGLGVLLAIWLTPGLRALIPASFSFAPNLAPDWRVFAYALALAVAAGLIFGLAPALGAGRASVIEDLKPGTPGAGTARSRLRGFMAAGQLTVSLVVLAAAGLCLRGMQRAERLDPGFDADHLLAVSFNLAPYGYQAEQGRAMLREYVARAARLPGVRAAALTDHLPLGIEDDTVTIQVAGVAPPPGQPGFAIDDAEVGPGYFRASGTPLLRGRDFREADVTAGDRIAVVNATLARRFWPRGDALGAQFYTGSGGQRQAWRIVGIAADGKYRSLQEPPTPFLYRLHEPETRATVLLRSTGSPAALSSAARALARALDSRLAPAIETMREHLAPQSFASRLSGVLFLGFGVLALALALIGLYGVIAYAAGQRTREFGLRLALGARPADLARLVLRQGLRLAAAGLGAGLAAALLLARLLRGLLFGVSTADPLVLGAAIVLLGALALAAAWIPARRVSRVDPAQALRSE